MCSVLCLISLEDLECCSSLVMFAGFCVCCNVSLTSHSFFSPQSLPLQYRHAVSSQPPMRKNPSSRSFQAFGFSANKSKDRESVPSYLPRRGSHINVNVAPSIAENDTPEIRKYKKRFNSDILCAALWGEHHVFNHSR